MAINTLLALLVAAVWLGCVGFLRLRTSLDRLHGVAFVNVAAGAMLIALVFAADGASTRAFKVVLIVATSVVAGSALSHALGRAMLYRERFGARGGDGE